MKRYKYYKKYKKRYKYIKLKYLLIIFSFLILIFIGFNIKSKNKLDISIDNLENFKISSENIIKLESLAKKYDLEFYEMLTYYTIENGFLENNKLNMENIEKEFIINYEKIKNKYKKKSIEEYINIFKNLFDEIETFPIPKEHKENYVYSDSYGAERTYGGKRKHKGTDIMDKDNIEKRIPIISMTDGTIENIGWNEKGGYRVGIKSKNGNYYYYAHLDSFEKNIEKGSEILAGDKIGYMGNTGYSKTEGTKGKFPVHLHLGIELNTPSINDEIWINPYPFLVLIENKGEDKK